MIKPALLIFVLALNATAAPDQPPANPATIPAARAVLKYIQGLPGRSEKRLLSGQFTEFGFKASDATKTMDQSSSALVPARRFWVQTMLTGMAVSPVLPPMRLRSNNGGAADWSRSRLIVPTRSAPILPSAVCATRMWMSRRCSIRSHQLMPSGCTSWISWPPVWNSFAMRVSW